MAQETRLPETSEQYAARQLARQITDTARWLHAYASEVDALAADVYLVGEPGTNSYADVVARVQHVILAALPNLGLSTLITAAQCADNARARGE